ncbi:MAG: JAB domain-containing protein [Lachnospiraceae bacterium]|nr:JAB domain-containing protein [Lachnospiraceae bacterium]
MNNNLLMRDLPEKLRPYEKCLRYGADSLSNEELLATIIKTGTNGESSIEVARRILKLNNGDGSLISIMHLSIEELMTVKGIGKVKAIQLKCVAELSKRIARSNAKEQLNFSKPSTIAEYYMEEMRHLEVEHLYVVFLDTKCRKLADKVMFMGTVNSSVISPREILIEALRVNAVNIIMLHNHPSGDPTPSKGDIASTKRIAEACKIVGVRLIDHIIIGDRTYVSLNENGTIRREHF